MDVVIWVLLGVIGLIFGSYAGALVWRLRARQLKDDHLAKEKVDKQEYKMLMPLIATKSLEDRSRCLNCHHTLAWYDLIPVVSWISAKGKCRYCHSAIGYFEPLIEAGTATLFVVSYICWPGEISTLQEIIFFSLWLISCVMLVVLFAYDLKWYLLPNRIIFPFIAIASISALFHVFSSGDSIATLFSIGLAIVILSGLYLMLWFFSKGAWIGFGDVKLGLGLAFLLGEWYLAFLALFLANFIGCMIVVPGMLMGKIKRSSRVPFGPLLITGAIVSMIWGSSIIDWYFGVFA